MAAPVDVAELVTAISARIALLTDWSESIYHPAAFPGRDPSSVADRAFAVWASDSEPIAGRQRPGAGFAYVRTTVLVPSLHQVAPLNQRQAALDILTREQALLNQLCGASWATNFHLTWAGSTRSLPPGLTGWELVTLRLSATHYLPVTA